MECKRRVNPKFGFEKGDGTLSVFAKKEFLSKKSPFSRSAGAPTGQTAEKRRPTGAVVQKSGEAPIKTDREVAKVAGVSPNNVLTSF